MSRRITYQPNELLYNRLQVDWPRRLLHIRTMISYERSGNNNYNGASAPKYGILTYTWGRFRAPDGSPALPVKGTTWSIPPVKEECFSVEAFQEVTNYIGREYDWVWIDVCCIDQENDEVKMEEIKRQVGIFHGASKAYVWLHSFGVRELERVVNPIIDLGDRIIFSPKLSGDWTRYLSSQIRPVLQAMRELLEDPWFTSLWTLQEATLRRDALLLSRDALPVTLEGPNDVQLFLSRLVDRFDAIFRHLTGALEEHSLHENCTGDAQDILRAIQKAGLNFFNARNPNVLYGAARHRQTQFPADRIFGIMAIFRVRVAPTSPDPQALEELQDMFAHTLNTRSPIGGQCFVHLGEPRDGKSWRITQNSAVPEALQEWDGERYVHSSSIVAKQGGYALLKGSCCPLQVLWAYWTKMHTRGTTWMNTRMRYRLTVAYDHALQKLLPEHLRANKETTYEQTKQEDPETAMPRIPDDPGFSVTRHLVKSFPPEDLCVFRLGHRDLTIPSTARIHLDQTKTQGGHLDEDCPQICLIQDGRRLAENEEVIELPSAPPKELDGRRWALRWNKAIQERKQSFGVIVLRYADGRHRRIGVCVWDDDNALPHELDQSSIHVY